MQHSKTLTRAGLRLWVSIPLLFAGTAMPGTVFADTVTCESVHSQRNYCPAYTRNGVTLQTQLSKSGCRQGSSWGYDSRGIWVANGCRAVFSTASSSHHNDHDDDDDAAAVLAGLAIVALGAAAVHQSHKDHHKHDAQQYQSNQRYGYNNSQAYYNQRYAQNATVNCDSMNNHYNYCRASVGNAHVRLLRQHSKSACQFHRDWGYNNGGIWVDNGCRATFEIDY
jgi:hypothetical protein